MMTHNIPCQSIKEMDDEIRILIYVAQTSQELNVHQICMFTNPPHRTNVITLHNNLIVARAVERTAT